MKTKLIILMIVILLVMPMVFAEQTQQFNKIFLNPFYRQSMEGDTDYTYSLEVNPPDRISEVKSAIITFQLWLNPTVEFFLEVDGQECNTPSYEVHTTYAGAGEGTIFFDCSNIITKAGTYEVVLNPDDDTGAVTGWIDMTYMNDPKGDVDIFGTEYIVGDYATIFLQLKDNTGEVINNGSCYIDVYYPSNATATHPIWLTKAPMIYKTGSEGLYFYDAYIPNYTGVYMINAECKYVMDGVWYYPAGSSLNSTRTSTVGTYSGSTLFLNDFADGTYTTCVSGVSPSRNCDAYYDFTLDEDANITSLDAYYSGESNDDTTVTMYAYNFSNSNWVTLPNSVSIVPSSTPTGANQFITNQVPVSLINNDVVRIRLYSTDTGTGSFTQWDNWLSLKASSNGTSIQDVKGSGELHINDWFDNIEASVGNISITLTNVSADLDGVAEEVWGYNGTIDDNILSQFATTFWNWTGSISSTILDAIKDAVWTRTDRNLTYYEEANATADVNETLIAIEVWDYVNRTLTYYETDASNLTAEDIWNYVNRNLTYYEGSGVTAEDVWNYTYRNLTYYETNASDLTAQEIWNYVNRNLTYYETNVSNLTAEEVWNYVNRNLTYYEGSGVTVEDIWNYTGRYTHGELI